MVSSIKGTNTNNEIVINQDSYIDFAWINDGNVDAESHKCKIYIDELEVLWAEVPNLAAGYYKTIVDGKYVFPSTGLHKLKLVIDADKNVDEIDDSDNEYVKEIYVHSTTSIGNENSLHNRISIYPNPTYGTFQLELQYAKSESHIIKITDLSGKIIWIEEIENMFSSISKRIDLHGNPPGIYFIHVSNSTSSAVKKIVIVK